MELSRVKYLVEQYFEGNTTKGEEEALANYFANHKTLDAELEAVRSMFVGISEIKTEIKAPSSTIVVHNHRRWWWSLATASIAAASLLVAVLIGFSLLNSDEDVATEPAIICYIDGAIVNDPLVAKGETDRILGGVANNMALAMASIEKLNILSIE